jgi:hypothetical protein
MVIAVRAERVNVSTRCPRGAACDLATSHPSLRDPASGARNSRMSHISLRVWKSADSNSRSFK